MDSVVQRRARLDPRTLVGRGKLEALVIRALDRGADLILFACDLSPSQARNISQATDLKVLDRTQLILDIFARRATSREGKLQGRTCATALPVAAARPAGYVAVPSRRRHRRPRTGRDSP